MFRMFKEGVDDLVMCPHPSNSELTKQLGARFDRELMYTNISDVLISVNPYKSLPITGEEFIRMYQNSAGSHDVPPHIYHLAERAYRRLVDDKESQCVIISGESGAGKTVAAKLILNYITTVSPSVSSGSGSSSSSSSSYSSSSSSSSSSYEPPSSSRPEPPSARGGARGRARGAGLSSSAGGAASRASYGVSESSSSSAPSSPYGGGGGSRPTPPAASGRPSPPSPAAAYTPPAPAPVRASPPPAATYGAPPPATYGAPPPAVRGAPPPAVRGAPPPAVRGTPPPPFGAPPRGGGRAGAQGPAGSRLRSGGRDVETIKKIIIDSNPVMEAFGNAKTVRNDNSSRFGKYLEIQFSDNSAPVGGVMSTFLLEKSRVAYQQKGERNFHIFYQLLAGISQYNPSMMDEFGLNRSASSFHYLSQGQCPTIEDVDDRAEFMVVTSAMRTIGFTDNEMDSMFQILAAILHLGDIQFEGETLGRVRNREALEFAAFLLGVDGSYLEMSLNHKSIQSGSARGTQFNVPQNAFQAGGIRDALSKTLYSRVFDFIVAKINSSMVYSGKTNVIGVLDIYGFEIFDRNSFEQFCINYVNERLQQIFIDLTVRGEQKEYHDEGLKWKDISFFDNKVVCELIEAKAPPGIFRVLDDTCKTAHALDSNTVDSKFLERLIRQFAENQYIEFPSGTGAGATQFTIKHYAGDVTYDIDEFCFKNNDNLYISLVQCMQTSSVSFIVSLFPENLANDKSTPSTAGFKIRESANYLVKRLSACTPHYIRCIKSNDKKLPMTFNESRVEHQVKYLGLLENVKVKRSGYAYRHFTDVFVQRFGPICDTPPSGFKDFLAQIGRKYKDIDVAEFEEGKTKVFVRTPETIFTLEEILFRVTDPEGYAARVKAYKESERIAQAKQGKHGLKQKCSLM